MEALRDPVKGCPWDKKQTLESIIPHSIEEVYEVAEQIYKKNYYQALKDELGDLLYIKWFTYHRYSRRER